MDLKLIHLGWLALLVLCAACGEDAETPSPAADTPECRLNSDCPVGELCRDEVCVPDDTEGPCEGPDCPCLSNGDCGIGEACDTVSGECFALECLKDVDCGLGEVCLLGLCETDLDADRDRDGFPDALDVCPDVQDISQEDSDGDGLGDECDPDDDNDALPDTLDNCPLVANADQFDRDNDRIGNLCDPDYRGMTLLGRLFSPIEDLDWPLLANVTVSGLATAADAEVSADGRFTASNLEPGLYTVQISVEGHLPTSRAVQLDGNGDFLMETISVAPEFEGGENTSVALAGRVELDGASSNAGATVRALIAESAVASAVTSADGLFVMQTARLNHTLIIESEGYVSRTVDVTWSDVRSRFEVGGEPLEETVLELNPAPAVGILRVTVDIQPEWIPQEQRHVDLQVIGDGFVATRQRVRHNTNDAPAEFTGLPVGNFFVVATRPGFSSAQATARITRDRQSDTIILSIQLESLATAGLIMSGVELDDTDIAQAQDLGVDFRFANLSGAILLVDSGTLNAPLDLSGANLRGADLAFSDLTGARFNGASLERADLSDTVLVGANFGLADLRGASLDRAVVAAEDEPVPADPCDPDAERPAARFDDAELSDITMREARLVGVELRDTDLSGARLQGADLSSACMTGAILTLARLGAATLDRADLSNASLINTFLDNTSAKGVVMDNASLIEAIVEDTDFGCTDDDVCASLLEVNLNGANLVGARFVGADLTFASMLGVLTGEGDTAYFPEAQPLNCELPETCDYGNIEDCNEEIPEGCLRSGTSFENSELLGVDAVGVVFNEVHFVGTDFEGAVMANAIFSGGEYTGASFLETELDQASFVGLNLVGVDFSDAFLNRARFDEAELAGANFGGADLTGTSFSEADLEDCFFDGAEINNTRFDGAFGTGTMFAGADITLASFRNASFNLSDFSNCFIISSDFSGIRLNETDFSSAFLGRVSFEGAELGFVDFSDTEGVANNFRSSTLFNVDLTSAVWGETDFRGANLTDSDFSEAVLNNTIFSDDTVCPSGELQDVEPGCGLLP